MNLVRFFVRFGFAVSLAVGALSSCQRCSTATQPVPPQRPRIRSTFSLREPGRPDVSGDYILQKPFGLKPGERPGLLLTFHADGRSEHGWDEPGAMTRLAKTGDRFKLITVALQEPHRGNWWQGRVDENIRYVDAFIQQVVLRSSAIDPRYIFFTGVSGGADFAGGIFPLHTGFKYHGAALVTCGGDLPERMLKVQSNVSPTREALAGFRFFFVNVDDDPDFPPALVAKTVAYYDRLGFNVASFTAGHRSLDGRRDMGQGHCSFDTPGWRDRLLEIYFRTEARRQLEVK